MSKHGHSGPEVMTGTVIRLFREKAFGFIKGEDGQEFFFHRSSIEAFADLTEGDAVRFLPTEGAKGLRAEQVERL
jgi:cold shock CspA family protein